MVQGGITVVIPTYNRAHALAAVLPSYLCEPMVARVVIVIDGSTDNTPAVVKQAAVMSSVPIDFVQHTTKLGAQRSRQSGISTVTTEWVLFGEDDVYLAPSYVATLLGQAKQHGADIIAGRLVTARISGEFSVDQLLDTEPRSNQELFDGKMLDMRAHLRPPQLVEVPFLHAIALVRRLVFDHASFDPWYAGNGYREETDFYLSAREHGYKILFTPDTVCFHLRGPICASGGQRINRLAIEYWNIVNTCYLLRKHWGLLSSDFDLRGGWLLAGLSYAMRREARQVGRILRGEVHSTFEA